MRQKIEYKKGDKIGNCIFIEELPKKIIGKNTIRRIALFECTCGNKFESILLAIKYGTTKSCGCIRDEKIKNQGLKNKTHGKRNHPLYKTWKNIIERCNNPENEAYHNYGGRGIKVCERWNNVTDFIEDMYPLYRKGLEIDRIDVNGNYCPENCRWVTRMENCNNMRKNRIIEYKGENKTIRQWSDKIEIPYKVLVYRINKWNINRAFTQKYNGKEKTYKI